jgi:hypothetical protein
LSQAVQVVGYQLEQVAAVELVEFWDLLLSLLAVLILVQSERVEQEHHLMERKAAQELILNLDR